MRSAARIGGFIVIGALAVVLLLELLMRVLPVGGRGLYAADPDPRWPLHHLQPHTKFTASMAWNLRNARSGTANNVGYVSSHDYADGPTDLVIIGDSYIESLMNPYADALQGQLPALLHRPMDIMTFGMSGYSMADYLAVAHLIGGRFPPKWAVVLLVTGDFVEGFGSQPGYATWDPAADPPVKIASEDRSAFRKLVRTSGVVQYLRGNLKVAPARLFRLPVWGEAPTAAAPAACAPVDVSDGDARLVELFLQRLPRELGISPEHVILLFDDDRRAIYEHRQPCPTRDSAVQQRLRTRAAQLSMVVIDLDAPFRSALRSGTKLDYYPLDLHWNARAHGIAAELVARTLNDADRGTPSP